MTARRTPPPAVRLSEAMSERERDPELDVMPTIAELRARLVAGQPHRGDLEAVVAIIDSLTASFTQAREAGELRRHGIRARDRELRRLAALHFADLAPTARAKRIAGLWRAYASAGWPRDRRYGALPLHLNNRPEEHLWLAMMVWKPNTLGWRQILNILQG